MDWKSAFLDSLTDTVKLVGPVISCEGVEFDSGSAKNAHVQSYVVAMDRVRFSCTVGIHRRHAANV